MANNTPFIRGDKVRESAEFSAKIKNRTDEREAIHTKTFTKWMNNKLAKANKPTQIHDLIEDLRDGHVLLTLLETLMSIKLPREKGKLRLHKLTNIKIVFEQLEKHGVKIVGINSGDIVDGMSRPILGLVWSIILRFQVQELFQGETAGTTSKDFHIEKRLLSWCQDVLNGYEDVIKLKDFTVGWRNGLAFNAIIHSHKPGLFEFDDLLENDNKTNLQHSFNVAQKEFNVDPLLEPSDIDVPQPDKKLIMMYLTSLYDVLKDYEPTRDRRNKRLQLKMELESYRSSYTEITLYISQVETIVLTKLDSDGHNSNPQEEHQIAKDLTKDTSDHVTDFNDVTQKGKKLLEDGKISHNDQQEIRTQIKELEIRWEKLIILVTRLSKRWQTALVVPRQRQIDYYMTWVRQTSRDLQQKGNATTPEQMVQELQDIEEIVSDIEENEPYIDKTVKDAEESCNDESIDEEIKRALQSQINVLTKEWEALKKDVLGKHIRLQQGVESLPNNKPITIVQDFSTVESSPPTSPSTAYQVEVRRINVQTPPSSPRLPKSNQSVEKLRTWKRKHEEARDVFSECEMEVKRLEREGDRRQFYEQYELCNQKVSQADPIIVNTVKHGQQLVQDSSLEEKNIDIVAQELESLVADYDNLLLQLDETKLKMDDSVQSEQSLVQEELKEWKDFRDELRPKLSKCHIELRKTKNKPIPFERVELLIYAKEVESCREEVIHLEPEVTEFLEDGNNLLNNDTMDNQDKEMVARSIHEMDNEFRTMKQDTDELKTKVDEVVRKEETQKEKQMEEWEVIRDELKPKIKERFVVLKQLKKKPVPFQRVDIRIRGEQVEACHQEVTSLDPEVSYFMEKSNELIQSGKLEEDEMRLVTKDMKDIDEQYEELRRESKDLKNKVEELIEREDKKAFDLTKWREWKHSISTNLDTIADSIEQIKSIETSKNLDSLEQNLLISEKCVNDLENLEPEIRSALEFGQETKDNSPLTDDEHEGITNDMVEMKTRYDALRDDTSNQNEWLKVYLDEQETSKANSLDKWQQTKEETTNLIDGCQSKVDDVDDNPQTREEIVAELAKAKEYAAEVPGIFQEVQSCYDYGNTLLADELLNQAEKDRVQHDAEEIGNKLRTLQNDVEMKQKRLNESLDQKAVEQKQDEMRFEKLSEWNRTKYRLDDILKRFQRDFRSLQSSPDPKNGEETTKRISKTADLSDKIKVKLPQIQSGYEYGNELLNDDDLREGDKDDIEADMKVLKNGFNYLKDDVNNEHKRLTDLLEEFKLEGNKVQVWRDKKVELKRLLEEARQIVKDLKSRPEPVTAEEIDAQLDETQDIYIERKGGSIPAIDTGLSYGNQLLKDTKISDLYKDEIEHDLETLEPAFKATREEFMNYYAWLQALEPAEETVQVEASPSVESQPDETDQGDPDNHRYVVRKYVTADQYFLILHDELTPEQRYEHEKQEKFRDWKSIIDRIDELLKRLMDKLDRLKSTDPNSYQHAKDHKDDAEDCIEEIQGSESMIQESIRLGNDLLRDDEVREEDKEVIRVYIRSLQVRLKQIQDDAGHEQGRAAKVIEDNYPNQTSEELIVQEDPITEQYSARGEDWDWSNLDQKHQRPKTKKELVDEEHFAHHRHGPEWELNFSDAEEEDEITHSSSDRVLPHDYFNHLHHDMTLEDRRRAEKDRKLHDWQNYQAKLDGLIVRLNTKLDRVKETDESSDWRTVKDMNDEAEDCKEEIEESEPMIREAFDHCDDMLNDPGFTAEEKEKIEEYVADMQIKLRNIHKEAADEEERLDILWNKTPHPLVIDEDYERIVEEKPVYQQYSHRPGFDLDFGDEPVDETIDKEHKTRGEFDLHFDDDHQAQEEEKKKKLAYSYITILLGELSSGQRADAKKAEKLENWRRWQNRLNAFLERQRNQIDRVSEVENPSDRQAVLELLDEAQECKEEIEDSKPRVMHAVECANELLQDDDLDDSDKAAIKEYVQEFESNLQDVYTDACDEEDRLNELLEKYPKQQSKQVDSGKLVDEEVHHAHSRERPQFELDFGDDRNDEVVHAMFVPSKPIHDYIWELHDDLDLDQRHEAEKREKLGQWRNWTYNLDDMVHHLNRRLQRVKETPKTRDDIIEQRDEAKEIQEDIEESRPSLLRAVDCANDLLADESFDDEGKEDVKNYIQHLTTQLRSIRDEAADEERKLNDLLAKTPADTKLTKRPVDEFHTRVIKEKPDWEMSFDDHQEEERKKRLEEAKKERDHKMNRWSDHRDRLNKLSESREKDLLGIMTVDEPTNQEEANQQIAKTEEFLDKLGVLMPTVKQSFDYGNDLLADETLAESDKDVVEGDMKNIREDLTETKRNADEHLQKLKDMRDGMVTIKVEVVDDVQAEPDMDTDSQRREAEIEDKLSRWKKSKDNLNDLLDQQRTKLTQIKTRDAPNNRKHIKEKINDIKSCREGVDGLEPEFKDNHDCAENVLNDVDIKDLDKQQVRRQVHELKSRRDGLRKECTDENHRLEVELSQLDAEKSEKFSKWRKWRELVRTLLDNQNNKLNKVKNSKTPNNRKSIEDQLNVLKDCEDGLRSSAPEIQYALEYGRHLSEDDILDVNEQKTVKQETEKFEKDLNGVKHDVEKEKERLCDALDKYNAVIRDKLAKWDDKKRSVKPSLDKLQNKVGVLKFKLKPRNKQGILERMAELEECKSELKDIEPNVKDCTKYGNDLLKDDSLDKVSKEMVKGDIDELKQDLNKVKQDLDDQIVTMKKLSDEEDQIKNEKQKKYRDWRKEIQALMDKLRGKLKRLPKSVEEAPKEDAKKDELTDLSKECSRDLDKLEEEVKSLKDYGKGLVSDGSLSDKESREINIDVAKLEEELKDIKQDNDVIKATIVEMNEQHPSEEDHPVMEEWRERVRKVFIGLDVAEDRLFDTSDLNTRAEIKERLDEVKELNAGFEESEPEFLKTVDFGKELLEKDDIPDNNKEEIKEDLISMAKQWGKLKSDGQAKEQSLENQFLTAADQSDELVGWHERCDDMQAWVDDTLSLLETRPVSLSSSFGSMKRQQSVTEEILEELVDKQLKVNGVIDDGNHLLDDQTCSTDEKKEIHEKMSKLYSDWDKLSFSLTQRQENIQDSLVQLEQQHKDLQEVWKKKYGPLRKWITNAQSRLNKEYAIAPDLDSVKKQRKDLEKFQAEKQSHTPEMNEITQMADNIVKGPQVNEEEKTVVQEEMHELQHGWNELDESIVWKQNRIEDTIRKLENQREDKLRKWQEGLRDVNPWISKTLEKISPEPKLANDVDSAYDQIDQFQNYVRDAPIYQDKVTNLNEFHTNLLTDPCLGEEERQKVGKEMKDCNEQWNMLVNVANSRQSTLETNLSSLEQQQNDEYNRWTSRSGRASELLDKFEAQLPLVDKPLGLQLEDVEKQEQEFDVFANQVELNESQMNDTFDLGEGVINDTKNSKAKRDGVQGQLNLLTSRWDRIKDFVDLRKARLEETAKRLRDNRKRKFEKWEERTNEFDLFLSAAERDIRSSDAIGDDMATVKKHNEEFKAVMSKVRSQKRKVFEYGQYTDDVIADPQLDAVSRDHIKIEKEARIDRWGHIEDMINNQQAKLRDKLQELEKGQFEMDGWNKRLNTVNNKISHLEQSTDITLGRDQDTIEKQRQEIKLLNVEKESVEEQVSTFLTFSEELMDKPGINTENRRHIDKECDNIELRWHKAKGELERKEKSLEEKQESLNRRQKNLLSEWDTRKTEASDWLTDMSTKVKAQDSQVANVDAARDQNQKLQHLRKDIMGYEKHVRNLEDFADTLILEPGIHSSEKGLVTREKQSIRERWESLNTAAHNVQKKLNSRADDLEGEQSRRVNDWRRQSGPLDQWLNETEVEVEAYEPVAYDIPMVEKQHKENQVITKQIERQKPKFDQLSNFANTLTSETFISLEEKVKIQSDMESLQDRLENVDDAVTKRQSDIETRLGELQDEERLRKQEEEQERLRREEERRQRQEERERLEEEQRRREYEEKKRREEEERRRREEEEERKRKEEEERQAEEERKRREQEQKKYTIQYEPRLSKPIEQEIMVQHEAIVESMQDTPEGWDDPFAEVGTFSQQDLSSWRDDADSIRQWMKQKENVLDDESDDEDIVGLKQQRKQMTLLENEVVEYEPKYEDVKTRYDALKGNEYISVDDKHSLDDDMDDVSTRWDNMAAAKRLKLKRLEDKIDQKEKKKLNDLIDCRADIKNLNDWMTTKNNQFDKYRPVADDLPTLLGQRDELKDLSKEIADKEPQLNGVMQTAHKLSKDPTLSPEESDVLKNEAEKCEQRWDKLNDKVKDRVDNLVNVLPAAQKKQKRLMDEWDDKLDRFKKSIKKSENTLDDQKAKWPTNEDEPVPNIDLTDELRGKVGQDEAIEWRPVVDKSNERLAKKRVRLQRIQREKRNRKWSILETIKGMFGFGKKPKKTGVNLDNLVIHLEDHEDLMQEVSSLQRPANEIGLNSKELMNSDNLEQTSIIRIDQDMRTVNKQWNQLNVSVIERENRLELLAKEIEDEYEGFDAWREKCESMNQFLNECQRLQKEEDKIGSDIKTLQEQSQDCKDFQREVDEYRPQAEAVFHTSQELIDAGKLDKSDMEGVEHTRDALKKRWDGINDHLKTRQESIDAKLLEAMKQDADGRLWKWRDQSLKLEFKVNDANRKLNSEVDETDFVTIHQSADELQSLESTIDDVFNTHSEVSDAGQNLFGTKTLEPHEEDEVNEAMNSLHVNIQKIQQSTKERKIKIKEANKKFFIRTLADMNTTASEYEECVNQEFNEVGSNTNAVEIQRGKIEKFEELIAAEEDKIEDLKNKLQESKAKGLVDDDDEAEILDEISKLEDKYARINQANEQNKKRLTQNLIVIHEEVLEEVNDWLKDTESQIDSIKIREDDLTTLKDDHAKHNELKEDIESFQPTFKGALSLSQKLLDDNVVDEERAESYKQDITSLNKRMDVINLKMMDNGTKFSNAFAMYLTTRLDDAEVSLTQAESKLERYEDKGYVDLDAVKKQLESSKGTLDEVNETKKEVDGIIDEADSLIEGGSFKKHEQDYFKPRVDKIGARNETLAEKAGQQQKRLFDTYIILLRQHLGKMDAWLFKAEERMRSSDEVESGYDKVNEQLEEHQKFQDEIREHSMVNIMLELDITDPDVNQSIQSQVKSLSERWAALWRWSEERRARLLRLLTNWQKFRDEQIALLNWLSAKEKILKDMGATDLSNEEEVKKHLDILKKLQTNLDEQGLKLQDLHHAGGELLKDVGDKNQAKKDVKKQLDEFDDCWNDIAKQVIERIHTLETSQSKLAEYHSEMNTVVHWMDETEEVIGSFTIDMPSEEATRLQEKLDIKCDERSKYQVKMERINRLGKDLQGTIDQPSYDFINDELKPFNQRWGKLSEQLENLSDKGYPTPGKSDCCLVRIMRQKLGICQN